MKIDLDKLRQSGRISATALAHGRKLIVPGAKLEDIQNEVERVIREMGGSPAFPAQSSRNHIAAHYCSPPGDATTVQAGALGSLMQAPVDVGGTPRCLSVVIADDDVHHAGAKAAGAEIVMAPLTQD